MTDLATVTQSYFQPHITGMAIPSRRPRRDGALDLSRNEMIHPALDPLVKAVLAELAPATVVEYPIYPELIGELADVVGCRPAELEIFPGSDDAIGVIVDAFATRTGSMVLQDPTYPTYRYHAQLRDIEVLSWLPRPGTLLFAAEDARWAMKRTPSTVVVVTDPHGMLGSVLDEEATQELAATAHRYGHLLVVDQCYEAFRGNAGAWRGWDNVLRIGSFSKGAGLAGMRLGYVTGAPPLVDYLRRWRRAAAVSGVTLAVALALCRDHRGELDAIRDDIIDGREWLAGQVVDLEKRLAPLPSNTNFLTVDAGGAEDARRLKEHLAASGVLVQSHAGFASLLRFTAAPISLLHRVVASLRDAPA
ncbi:aminotransferase class I/II-fold pyridoxal phosphate-dependent enzyme [Amycolatopsis pithecellobii]|uniref:Aminotransferase n=1 Tax=Amycolatopsis pithecellobii TaxID=664692 RepID=A0A6N7Z0X8_9PSEU|nr:aminotransferase class I/II-fold pyridoxal phosphate-dependent enzyme [Amycolatopsis pithecellobii]MTD57972.1 aminotransferase class I/II-fold pyridoxal phosphate-dependent enzyme [Amycolatopsis pithecellobii]